MSETTKKPRTTKAAVPVEAPVSEPTKVGVDVEAVLEQNARLMEQINQLTLAVIAGREAPKALATDEKADIKLINTIGYSIAFPVTDPRTGATRQIALRKKDDTVLVRTSELAEALEKYPHYFEKGYISAPDHLPENANTIRDVAKWLGEVTFENVTTVVEEIDSLPTLYLIYNHIEEKRWKAVVGEDANGKKQHKLEERKLDPKLLTVEMMVKRRIDALNGISVNLDK